MKTNIETEFETVRNIFFPRWDRKRLWQVEVVGDLDGSQGKCLTDTKTIKILDGVTGLDLTALLIHEIAHAVVNVYHGKKWQTKMMEVAHEAEHIGKHYLAEVLRKQVADYADPDNEMTAAMVYQELEDAVWHRPEVEFEHVVDWLRRDGGMSRAEFLRRYRRARAIFDVAKVDAEERAIARARMKGM
jgi:hypothetical protein